jgi:hypothetical protein
MTTDWRPKVSERVFVPSMHLHGVVLEVMMRGLRDVPDAYVAVADGAQWYTLAELQPALTRQDVQDAARDMDRECTCGHWMCEHPFGRSCDECECRVFEAGPLPQRQKTWPCWLALGARVAFEDPHAGSGVGYVNHIRRDGATALVERGDCIGVYSDPGVDWYFTAGTEGFLVKFSQDLSSLEVDRSWMRQIAPGKWAYDLCCCTCGKPTGKTSATAWASLVLCARCHVNHVTIWAERLRTDEHNRHLIGRYVRTIRGPLVHGLVVGVGGCTDDGTFTTYAVDILRSTDDEGPQRVMRGMGMCNVSLRQRVVEGPQDLEHHVSDALRRAANRAIVAWALKNPPRRVREFGQAKGPAFEAWRAALLGVAETFTLVEPPMVLRGDDVMQPTLG